jgi:hypothetical protein
LTTGTEVWAGVEELEDDDEELLATGKFEELLEELEEDVFSA